jgi:hypothetical protein
MITKATDKFPEIDWEVINDLLEHDPEERMDVFTAEGESKDGRKFQGSAYYFCDILDEIKDIEEI